MGSCIGIDASGPLLRWVFVLQKCKTIDDSVKIEFHRSVKFEKTTIVDSLFDDEVALTDWLSEINCWHHPWYDTHLSGDNKIVRIYYAITHWSNIYPLLSNGIDRLLKLKNERKESRPYTVRCTGSRRKDLSRIADEIIGMKHLMAPSSGYNGLPEFIKLRGLQEINCTIRGFDFFLKSQPAGCFKYKSPVNRLTIAGKLSDPLDDSKHNYNDVDVFGALENNDHDLVTENIYPYLLVHIKNGCSFHLVNSSGEVKRVGGCVIGAGTFLGLASILCPSATTPFDAFVMACTGDNSKVDIQVSDIYGGSYGLVGLEGGLIASSFGKMQPTKLKETVRAQLEKLFTKSRGKSSLNDDNPLTKSNEVKTLSLLENLNMDDGESIDEDIIKKSVIESTTTTPNIGEQSTKRSDEVTDEGRKSDDEHSEDEIRECDIARSLLTLVTYNLTQQAYLNALILKVPRIVFSGFYLEMPGYLSALQACIHFWNSTGGIGDVRMRGDIDTVFSRMAPFLAAVGASLSP